MEKEVAELQKLSTSGGAAAGASEGESGELEELGVFVSGIGKEVDANMLQSHFGSCGVIDRITIMLDKFKESKGCVPHIIVSFEPNVIRIFPSTDIVTWSSRIKVE